MTAPAPTKNEDFIIRPPVRTPRSAALAGIVFSVLLTITMVLITQVVSDVPAVIDQAWLEARLSSVSPALALVPFAGIALLWFTGVVRDRLGEREDRFFATVFLGSGLILVTMIFIWAAIIGAIFGTYVAAGDTLINSDVYLFGFRFMNEILGNFILRMAGVYMLSIGTLWTRTGTMPRWLTILTYFLALGFIFFAGSIREARFVFPAWVFLVSTFVLITNRRIAS